MTLKTEDVCTGILKTKLADKGININDVDDVINKVFNDMNFTRDKGNMIFKSGSTGMDDAMAEQYKSVLNTISRRLLVAKSYDISFVRQTVAIDNLKNQLKSEPNLHKKSPIEFFRSHFVRNWSDDVGAGNNLESMIVAKQAEYKGKLATIFHKYGDLIGDRKANNDLLRLESILQKTGGTPPKDGFDPNIIAFATELHTLNKKLNDELMKSGLPFIEEANYRMKQSHNRTKIGSDREAWRNTIRENVNWEETIINLMATGSDTIDQELALRLFTAAKGKFAKIEPDDLTKMIDSIIANIEKNIIYGKEEDFLTVGRNDFSEQMKSLDSQEKHKLSKIDRNIQDIMKDINYDPNNTQSKVGQLLTAPRTLKFKSTEHFIAYNDRFGNSFAESLMSSFDAKARDIATFNRVGLDPYGYAQMVGKTIIDEFSSRDITDKSLDMIGFMQKDAQRMVDAVLNVSDKPPDMVLDARASTWEKLNEFDYVGAAKTSASLSFLGGVRLSSILDMPNMMVATTKGMGISGWSLLKVLPELFPMSMPNRVKSEIANELGLSASTIFSHAQYHMAKIADQGGTKQFGKQASSVFYNWTNMNAYTDNMQSFVVQELSDSLSKGQTWANLNKIQQRLLKSHGIDSIEWQVVGELSSKFGFGTKMIDNIDPQVFAKRAKELGITRTQPQIKDSIAAMMVSSAERAILVPRAEARMSMDFVKGGKTVEGIKDLIMTFKSYPISQYQTFFHPEKGLFRKIYDNEGAGSTALTGAAWMMFSAGLGLYITQIKQLSRGETFLPLDSKELWTRALTMSLGVGVGTEVATSFFTGETAAERMSGIGQFAVGAPIGQAFRTVSDTYDFARKASSGDEDATRKAGARLVSRVRGYVPAQNLYYARYGIDRIFDYLSGLIDSEYDDRKSELREKRGVKLIGEE